MQESVRIIVEQIYLLFLELLVSFTLSNAVWGVRPRYAHTESYESRIRHEVLRPDPNYKTNSSKGESNYEADLVCHPNLMP